MEFSLTTGIASALAASLVLFAGLLYLRTLSERPAGLDYWIAAFGLGVVRYAAYFAAPHVGRAATDFIAESLQAATAVLLLAGVLKFVGRRVDRRAVAAAVSAVTLWAGLTSFVYDDFMLRAVPLYAASGTALIATAVVLVRAGGWSLRTGYAITALAFALWGVHKLDYPFLRPVEWFAPIGFVLGHVFAMAAALGLLIMAMRRLQQNVERTERALGESYEAQRTVSDILRLSLSDRPLADKLRSALDLVLGISWLSIDPRGGIFLTGDTPGDPLRLVAHRGLPDGVAAGCAQIAAGQALCGRSAARGHTVYAPCLGARHEFRAPNMESHGHYAVPIKTGTHMLGVLVLYLDPAHARSEREVEALETIAGTLAALVERARADAALRCSEERFRDATEVSSDWFWEIDPEFRFVHLSERFAHHTGMDPERILGRKWTDWGAGLTEPKAWIGQLRAMKSHNPFRNFEYSFETASGTVSCWSISGKPTYDPDGRFAGYRGTARDVTADKLNRLALADAKRQAEIANRAKTEFLANMSHELRTPLNAIIGFSEIIVGRVFGDDQERYRDYAQDIVDSGRHLLTIINDILDIAKIESGRLDLSDDRVTVATTLRACLNIVRERASAAGLELAAELPDRLPEVRADERALKQVLLNLLTNAIKFTKSGGQVTVTAARTTDGGLAVQVADSGIGIAQEDLERVFSPFEQVENAMSRTAEGTGLGLPLARSLVELHGGRVEIDSAPGVGTTVTVLLPPERVLPAEAEAEAAPETQAMGRMLTP